MELQDEAILDHLGRYTISIKRVIEESCLDGRSSQGATARLIKANLVRGVDKGLGGKFRYYQLTTAGAKRRNFPVNRGRPDKDPKSLAQDLAALWFSCMGPVPRKRLLNEELESLFGAPKGNNIIHVAQLDDQDTTIFRLCIPGDDTSLKSFVSNLRKLAYDAASDSRMLRWIERGTYRFAILVQNEYRQEEVTRLIKKEEFPDIRIELDIAPSPTTLKDFLASEED